MAYSGLTADGRILANKARIECQSYRLNYDDSPPVEYISKYIAETKQKYTQKGGVRPFGISCIIAGFDTQAKPHLYYTDPSGSFSEWKAQSCGRNSKQVSEFLEKHYRDGLGNEEGLKLVVKALLDVVESGNKNIELMVISQNETRMLSDEEIEKLIEIAKE
jgi:20S proteasome subunit alpha 4